MVRCILVALSLILVINISIRLRRNSNVSNDFHRQLRISNINNDPKTVKNKGASSCERVNVEEQLWFYAGDKKFKDQWFVDSNYEFKSKDSRNDIQSVFDAAYVPNIEMVVSVCYEKIDPIVEYATKLGVVKLFIYSKYKQPLQIQSKIGEMQIHIEELENVGRQGHTYLSHMLRKNEYHDPNRWTLFYEGGLEKTIEQTMLAIVSAHEHDNQGDGTNFINTYRIMDEFCKPLQLSAHLKKESSTRKWHDELRYQRTDGDNNFLDFMAKEITFGGEFLMKNSLFISLNRPKLLDLKSRLERGNDPIEGHVLERFWIRVLNARDNCRCDGMPLNKFNLGLANIFM